MEIALIGDRHTAYGFKLAGVKQTLLTDELKTSDIREVLKSLFDGFPVYILIFGLNKFIDAFPDHFFNVNPRLSAIDKLKYAVTINYPNYIGSVLYQGTPLFLTFP